MRGVSEVGTRVPGVKVSPQGQRPGVSRASMGVPVNGGRGRSHAQSFAPDPEPTHCMETREGGWQKCGANPALGTPYCIGHLRGKHKDLYDEVRSE